jgi:hypothetical protein
MGMARSTGGCHNDVMDEAALSLCLHHLEEAERLMVEGVDGWHLARLSHVIEAIKEAYGPQTTVTAASAVQ